MDESEYKKLLVRAAAYCSKAEKAPLDVMKKLDSWSNGVADAETKARILDVLKSQLYSATHKDLLVPLIFHYSFGLSKFVLDNDLLSLCANSKKRSSGSSSRYTRHPRPSTWLVP